MSPANLAPSEPAEAIAAAWRAAYGAWDPFEAAAFHAVVRRTLRRLLEALEKIEVPALVVKGALLANTVYPDPTERPLRDLDLRVRAADLSKVARFFHAQPGAKVVRESRIGANVVAHFEGIEVDVESRLGPPMLCASGIADVLARARRTSDDLGFEHWRIDVNDHALLLAINFFKDHVGAKPWSLWDLVRIVRVPGFDPRVLAARAVEAGCTTILHVVARHLADTRDDARSAQREWAEVAADVTPARPGYAARMVATLSGTRNLPRPLRRLEVRAAADSRVRSLLAVAVSAAWTWTEFGSTARAGRT